MGTLEIIKISGEPFAQFDVEASLKVIDLKAKLQDYLQPPLCVQTLLRDGDELDNAESLMKLLPQRTDDSTIVLTAIVSSIVQVSLLDRTTRDIPASNETTCQELSDKMAAAMEIQSSEGF